MLLTACGATAGEVPEIETSVETDTSVEVVEEAAEGEMIITEAPAVETTEEPMEELAVEEEIPEPTNIPAATATKAIQPTSQPPTAYPEPTELQVTVSHQVEPRVVEVEWPGRLYLGDTDVVRLSLIPAANGYELVSEFPDHQTITQSVPVVRPVDFDLYAIARLGGLGFEIAPEKEQNSMLPSGEVVTWHWSIIPKSPGRHRLTTSLTFRWEPRSGINEQPREAVAYSKGLDVRVSSFMGMSRRQTLISALIGILLSGGLILFSVILRQPFAENQTQTVNNIPVQGKEFQSISGVEIYPPNSSLVIELAHGIGIAHAEENVLRSLFHAYDRIIIQQEFQSGYSDARTFLVVPIQSSGRADAPTIAKLGSQSAIVGEYANYNTYVKNTLPPITARIQSSPIQPPDSSNLAALRYTFIGKPGTQPVSLREELIANPDPKYLEILFETFGPNWWMQRSPWTFNLAQEYDRLFPPHAVIEPYQGVGEVIIGNKPINRQQFTIGNQVRLNGFTVEDFGYANKPYLTLIGDAVSLYPQCRLRWLGTEIPGKPTGTTVATRNDLLRSFVKDFNLQDFPDPLIILPDIINRSITGTRSTIHGDLNLENILVGPGGLVWLIDFATTREGHPLMDFAHLETEIIAHVITSESISPAEFIALLEASGFRFPGIKIKPTSTTTEFLPLLGAIHKIAYNCLANPSQPDEYHYALYLSCLGALKYRNLDDYQKYILYLTAAWLASQFSK